MTKIFFHFALLLVASYVRNIQTASISDVPGDLNSITNSSSSEDVLNAVSSMANGSLDAGVDEVLNELHEVIQNQIDNINDTIKDLGIDECKRCPQIFGRVLKSINRDQNQELDEDQPEQAVISYFANSVDNFLKNVTKTMYKNVDILQELSVQYKTNHSIDDDSKLVIIICVHDEIIYYMQEYEEKIADTLKKLLNTNFLTVADDIITADWDLKNELIGLTTKYYTTLESKKKDMNDVASGMGIKSLNDVVKNLKSIENRKKTNRKVKSIIRDVQNKLNGKTYTIDDLVEAIKSDKASDFYSTFQMILLQSGYKLIQGVNNVSESEVLENTVNNLNNTDHTKLVNTVGDAYKQISEKIQNSLAEILKEEILDITNPSIKSDFQIEWNCYSQVGQYLTQATETIEKTSSSESKDSIGSEGLCSSESEDSMESKESSSGESGGSGGSQGSGSSGSGDSSDSQESGSSEGGDSGKSHILGFADSGSSNESQTLGVAGSGAADKFQGSGSSKSKDSGGSSSGSQGSGSEGSGESGRSKESDESKESSSGESKKSGESKESGSGGSVGSSESQVLGFAGNKSAGDTQGLGFSES